MGLKASNKISPQHYLATLNYKSLLGELWLSRTLALGSFTSLLIGRFFNLLLSLRLFNEGFNVLASRL